MTRTMLLSVALASGIELLANAQERPAFNGTWVMDMTRSESAAQAPDAAPKTPVSIGITQRPDALTIQTIRDGHSETVSYSFERVEPEAVGTAGSDNPNATRIIRTLVRWDGPVLVTETVYSVNGMATSKTERRRLSADGREMTVETELQVEHGYESNSRGPAGYGTAKDVYVKDGGR
jgi:hypothetical protein